jgi:hypothetical protein
MAKNVRRYYLLALGALLALSAYPLVMGLKIVALQLLQGGIRTEDYARWVIPYTAVSLSLLAVCALYPALSKLGRRAVPAATVLALGLFVVLELLVESVTIKSSAVQTALTAQLLSCVYTPAAVSAFNGVYDDSYKIHYFLVSAVLIALAAGLFYGWGALLSGGDRRKRTPLVLQSAVAALYLGLCVFANFTGFFREKTDTLTPLSAFLTGLFFVVLGAAAGIYTGSWLIDRGRLLSVWLPAAVAALVCLVMYFGEYSMLGGTLYRFGEGWFFEGLPGAVLSPADVLIVLASGGAAAGAMAIARGAWGKPGRVTPSM